MCSGGADVIGLAERIRQFRRGAGSDEPTRADVRITLDPANTILIPNATIARLGADNFTSV
jgi:hypothetical protein